MGLGLFTVSPGAESQLFNTAFYRFLEIRGWTYTDSKGRCALNTISTVALEIKVVALWSERAVTEFEAFWPRYRQVYGQPQQEPAPANVAQDR